MPSFAPYIVLIEHRRLLRAAVAAITSLALLIPGVGLQMAHAGPGGERRGKVARDLGDEVGAPAAQRPGWSRNIGGVPYVQAIVVGDSSDPQMTDLRAQVLKLGGAVHAVHPAMHTVTVQIKASDVAVLAQRSDVLSVSPNRSTQRTSSTLEVVTGSLTSTVRSYTTKANYAGLDGTGIGIAVLDSGVMKNHRAFNDAAGVKRVRKNINMLNTTAAT